MRSAAGKGAPITASRKKKPPKNNQYCKRNWIRAASGRLGCFAWGSFSMKTLVCFRTQLNTSPYDNKFGACWQILLEKEKIFHTFFWHKGHQKKIRNQKKYIVLGKMQNFKEQILVKKKAWKPPKTKILEASSNNWQSARREGVCKKSTLFAVFCSRICSQGLIPKNSALQDRVLLVHQSKPKK